jgi:hypothetical protein
MFFIESPKAQTIARMSLAVFLNYVYIKQFSSLIITDRIGRNAIAVVIELYGFPRKMTFELNAKIASTVIIILILRLFLTILLRRSLLIDVDNELPLLPDIKDVADEQEVFTLLVHQYLLCVREKGTDVRVCSVAHVCC